MEKIKERRFEVEKKTREFREREKRGSVEG